MAARRTTLYLDSKVYRALKVKAALTDRAMSDVVNEALVCSLREDAIDIQALHKRAKEPSRPLSDVLRDLRRAGLL